MSNVLTDEEIMSIRNRAKLNDNRQIDPMAFAREIERAVLAKAGEQEPVAWIVRCKRSGLIEQAEPNEKATNPDYWTDSFPVYAHQLPAQAENPLVDAVFAASHKKATDTHSKCPHCSHECEQAIPDGYVHVDDVIQLCKDFSSRNGSVYIGDVEAAISGLSASPGTPKV